MNHFELPALIQNFQPIYMFLVNRGLLASQHECVCDAQMILKERQNTTDGYMYIWECPSSNCRKHRSVRVGSFFEDSHISLPQWLYVIYLWSGADPGEVKWVNFHPPPPFSELPSFFLFFLSLKY